jgi:hypothetical protein
MDQATIAPSVEPPSQNTYACFAEADEDSAPADGTPHKVNNEFGHSRAMSTNNDTTHDDGTSQPLIDKVMLTGADIPPDDNAVDGTMIFDALAEHDRVLTLAITNVIDREDITENVHPPAATNPATSTINATLPEPMMVSMMLLLQTMQSTSQAILARLDNMDSTIAANKLQQGWLCTAINAKADSSEIACLDKRLGDLADNVASTVRDEINASLGLKIYKASATILDLKANLQHLTKKFSTADATTTTCIDDHITSTQTRFEEVILQIDAHLDKLAKPPPAQTADVSTTGPPDTTIDVTVDADNAGEVTVAVDTDYDGHTNLPPSSSPATPATALTPITLRKAMEPSGVLGANFVYDMPAAPGGSAGTYTLPTGHFGSGLGGPSALSCSKYRHTHSNDLNDTAANARAAHAAGHQRLIAMGPLLNPYQTPSRTTQIDTAQDDNDRGPRPSLPCVDGLILLPHTQQERAKGVNWYNIEILANPHYHCKESGVPTLTIGYLERCGYNKLSSDNVVGSLNKISPPTIVFRKPDTTPVAIPMAPRLIASY